MNLINFTKDKTDLEKVALIKKIVDVDLSRILNVCKKKNVLLLKEFKYMQLNKKYFNECLDIIIKEIETRPNPNDRVEGWECDDIEGVYSYKMEQRLLNYRRKIKPRDKIIYEKRKIKEISPGLPDYMIDIFMNELKIAEIDDSGYEKERKKAKLLGLI